MRIAFTFHLGVSNAEKQAGVDSPVTVQLITTALKNLGHDILAIDISGSLSRTIAALENFSPELIFNTAESHNGRTREALFPAMFEYLDLPYTGPGPYALAITLDKQLTKNMLASYGIKVPEGILICQRRQLNFAGIDYPVIVKPNYESSSNQWITSQSVVRSPNDLAKKIDAMLDRYPEGVLVEEFLAGRNVVVPFLEGIALHRCGVLNPVEYQVKKDIAGEDGSASYDYNLKTDLNNPLQVRSPAELSVQQAGDLLYMAKTAVKAFDIRDFGQFDFRITDSGEIFFLGINALPSLETTTDIYASAALEGLTQIEQVLAAIIESACRRWKKTPIRNRSAFFPPKYK